MIAARRPRKLRAAALAGAVAALAAGAALALRPARVDVETAPVARGPLRVTVDGTGKTRVRDLFVVASPVSGHLERLGLREGDAVQAGDRLATVAAASPAPLDHRTRTELEARVAAARAAQAEARAAVERARAASAQATRDLSRARDLAREGALAPVQAEAADLAARERAEEARMADSAARRAANEVEAARAALAGAALRSGERVTLRAPCSGRVLRVHRESEGPIAAGGAILELGDPAALEADVELLTAQAVRVRPGAAVELVRWGGEGPLPGTLRRLDPAAYTKVSALGVEEQRVHAVVVPAGRGWGALGDGFAVEARIVVLERDALKVPGSALFRHGARWAVFVVERGRARLRPVEVGESSGVEVAIEGGLAEGERVVLHPSDRLADGVRVAQ
jgi:HlyD family secretion protein